MAQAPQQQQGNSRELTPVGALAQMRLPITGPMMQRLGVTEGEWRVLCDSTFPAARTVEAVALALSYCKHRKLDIFKKPVHIVPMYSAALKRMVETVWPSIAEIRTTATRTGSYAGIDDVEFGPLIEREFISYGEDEQRQKQEFKTTVEYPEWARVVVWRLVNGIRCPFVAKVFWRELYATSGRGSELPNEMWRKRPYGQLDKCVEAAALRKAFPEELGNEYAAEEMEGRALDDGAPVQFVAAPDQAASAPRPPKAFPASAAQTATDKPAKAETAKVADKPADSVQQPSRPAQTARQPEPEQRGGDKIEDAVVEEINEDQLQADTDFVNALRRDLAAAADPASLEEVWTTHDPEGRFANDEAWLEACMRARSNNLKRLGVS